jgi:glycosyltransferase involved in cell wall biosynthesis
LYYTGFYMHTNKNVLYISYDGMTDPLGQSQVIPYLQQLTKQGYHFTILSVEKKKRLSESGQQIRELLTEMGIEWKTLIFSTKPPILSKIYDQWKLNITAARLYKKKKFDLIHCRSYVAAAAGLKLLRRFGVPFLFDMRGFWVDERVDSGHWNIHNPLYRFFYKLYKKKEKRYFLKSTHIISLTQKGKEELIRAYNVAANKISVIPCCADLEHFDYRKINNDDKQKAKEQLKISNENKVLTYLGSLGGWYMTDEMLDFFAVLKKKISGIIFLFVTHDGREKILEMAAAKGIAPHDIRVQPASRDEVPLYLSVSDWGIFFIKDVYSKKASSPTKQGEIMAMGIPIICNDVGDTGKIVNITKAGIIINEFDNESYSKAADQLLKMSAAPSPSIREGAFQYYDLYAGARNYLEVYKKLFA